MSAALRKTAMALGGKLTLVTVAAGLAVLLGPSAGATDPPGVPVIMVQEDWVLVLNEPNDTIDSPQFHTAMSPYGNLDSVYLQATWNYWEQPDFQPGGLQLEAWENDDCRYSKGFLDFQQLSTDAETITWTQSLATNGEVLSFQIDNGNSQTWGVFGGETMSLHGDLHVADLNGYRPQTSVENSWVTYGSNRVNFLAITEVRYYGATGLLYQDTTPKVVFQIASE